MNHSHLWLHTECTHLFAQWVFITLCMFRFVFCFSLKWWKERSSMFAYQVLLQIWQDKSVAETHEILKNHLVTTFWGRHKPIIGLNVLTMAKHHWMKNNLQSCTMLEKCIKLSSRTTGRWFMTLAVLCSCHRRNVNIFYWKSSTRGGLLQVLCWDCWLTTNNVLASHNMVVVLLLSKVPSTLSGNVNGHTLLPDHTRYQNDIISTKTK